MRYRNLVAALAAASLPAALDTGAIARASELAHLALGPHHYWVPQHFLLLYLRAPLVAISAGVLFLAPGLLLTLRAKAVRSFALWIVASFIVSLVLLSSTAAVAQLGLGRPLAGVSFMLFLAALFTVAAVAGWRREQGRDETPEALKDFTLPALASLAVPVFLIVAVLVPKFFWENFNHDGAHTFEIARVLLHEPLPFLPPEADRYSAYPDLASFLYAYPASWYERLFGEVEASARLPLTLYLVVLASGVAAFAEFGKTRLPDRFRWLLWVGLVTFVTTVAYSTTYSLYSADLAKPAGQDSLLVAMCLAHAVFVVKDRPVWAAAALVLAYAALPTAALVIGLWLAGAAVTKAAKRRTIAICAATLAACLLSDAVLARFVLFDGVTRPRNDSLIWYYTYLQLAQWQRIWYVVIPAGILPFCSLLLWKRLDAPGRALAFTAALFFALAYIQSQTALHHFIPAMLLPLPVFWRLSNSSLARRSVVFPGAVILSGVIAFALSLPESLHTGIEARQTGSTIVDRVPENHSPYPRYVGMRLLGGIFRDPVTGTRIPAAGSILQLRFYSQHPARSAGPPAYVLQPRTSPPPRGATVIESDSKATLYALSDPIWRSHRGMRPVTAVGSPIYRIPPQSRFRDRVMREHPQNMSVLKGLARAGIDTAALRARGLWH